MRLFGDGAHLDINIRRELKNVVRIGAAQVITLIKNFDTHAAVAGVLHLRLLCGCCHLCSLRLGLQFSWQPAPPPCDRSGQPFSRPAPESLRVLSSTPPSLASGSPLVLPAPQSAHATALHPARQLPAPPGPTCIAQ